VAPRRHWRGGRRRELRRPYDVLVMVCSDQGGLIAGGHVVGVIDYRHGVEVTTVVGYTADWGEAVRWGQGVAAAWRAAGCRVQLTAG